MYFISSDRLKLIPLSHYQLQLMARSRSELDNLLKLMPCEQVFEPGIMAELTDALENFWLPQTLANPQDYSWFTNWDIVLKKKSVSIGGIGFAGIPDENGQTMVGYAISKLHEGQGFASEALQCLLRWGFRQPSLKRIVATTPLDNIGSQRVLFKNDFTNMGQFGGLVHWQLNRL